MKIFRSPDLWTSPDLTEQEDLTFVSGEMNLDDLLKGDVDLIEPSYSLFLQIAPKFKIIDWTADVVGMVDAVVRQNGIYKPVQLASKAFSTILSEKKYSVDTTKTVVLIGDLLTCTSFFPNLIQMGFRNFILVSTEPEEVHMQFTKLSKAFFDLSFIVYAMDDINKIFDQASVLVVDIDHKSYPDTIESLIYFNFVANRALFLDVRSGNDKLLFDEAERASLQVIPSKLFHTTRYNLAKKLLTPKKL